MTGQSRAAASQLDSESFVNGPAGGPEPPRLDVSGTDRSPALARYPDSDEDDEDDEPDEGEEDIAIRGTQESQIVRCYRCEAVTNYTSGDVLQVCSCGPVHCYSLLISISENF